MLEFFVRRFLSEPRHITHILIRLAGLCNFRRVVQTGCDCHNLEVSVIVQNWTAWQGFARVCVYFPLQDSVTGDYVFEAGAVVLGDRGVCCVDEFDKMTTEHQSLLEAMEQQEVRGSCHVMLGHVIFIFYILFITMCMMVVGLPLNLPYK